MKREKPHLGILHRELHVHDVNAHFLAQLEVLREVVDYGTNLVISAFHSSKKDLSAVIVIAAQLKQFVSMLDALEVLISNGCGPAALLQSRAMFEASVCIDFILAGKDDEKATYFYVAHLRRELMWALRSQPVSVESAFFFEALGEFGDTLRETQETIAKNSGEHIDQIKQLLSK